MVTKKNSRSPWAWIPTLYFAEGLPNVIVTALSVVMYMQLGLTDAEVGLYTGWLALPWVIKPLWSPFIDLLKTKRWWVLTMQALIGAALAGIAFSLPTAFWFQATMCFFFLIAFCSATHDISADGFYMIEQIVIMVEDVYNNGLNVNSVRFNMDDVYINEMTKEMYFIYFPIVGGQESADIVGFIENIIYTMTPVINEDTNYISRFMYYVRSFHGFNGNAIEKYISREERAVVNVLKNKAVTMQQTMQQQIMQQQTMQQQTMQQQIMQQVMQGSMDGTTVLSDDGISVQQIQQMQPVNYHFASLTRQVTGEKIELGKPSFVLGKNPEKSDYAVADNTNISRVHAVITMRNGRYYVMDQNSTNGTFINGRIIKAGQETEILPGDCLMLANEEFIFNE